MKTNFITGSLLGAGLFLLASSPVFASVITLDDIPLNFRNQNLPSYTEGDFTIAASCTDCSNVFSTTEANAGYGATTGAAGWGASGRFIETWNTRVTFTLTQTSGSAFDFLGFDIGWFDNSTSNASWNLQAFNGLGALLANDSYTGKGHFDLNYQNVSSIVLRSNGGYSSFDNLMVSSVAESSTLMLFGFGLLGLGMSRRRNKAA
jgi:hypothetical protein